MRAVIDSSSWISLARAGLLGVLGASGVEPVLLDVVRVEIIEEGRRGGYADASVLATALARLAVSPTPPDEQADGRVLDGAKETGLLVANDLALGRRARSLGISWIRSADLIVLAVESGAVSRVEGMEGIAALEASGRITSELADAYRDRLR